MKKYILILSSFLLAFPAQAQTAKITQSPPVVLELFTSESCSSCPPADAFLTTLKDEPGVIILSCHVTYWNYLNWKDTHSLPECTQRQRIYAPAVSQGQVFTPQLVMNGTSSFVGSSESSITAALQNARISSKVQPIILTSHSNGQVEAQTDQNFLKLNPSAEFTFFEIGPAQDVAVKSGENSGSILHSARPVRSLNSLGKWKSDTEKMQVPIILNAGTKFVVLLAQNPATQEIVAAGQLNISN